MSDFLKDVIKETGNEYASLVSDGSTGDVTDFIDTGSQSQATYFTTKVKNLFLIHPKHL